VENAGNEVSLDIGRIYKIIKPHRFDRTAVRVIDNDGEDYLYSPDQFIAVDLPVRARRIVAQAVPLG
jgi:hypothetical protein